MVKGFSDNEVKNDAEIKESKKEKKGFPTFLKGKKLLTLCQIKNK